MHRHVLNLYRFIYSSKKPKQSCSVYFAFAYIHLHFLLIHAQAEIFQNKSIYVYYIEYTYTSRSVGWFMLSSCSIQIYCFIIYHDGVVVVMMSIILLFPICVKFFGRYFVRTGNLMCSLFILKLWFSAKFVLCSCSLLHG